MKVAEQRKQGFGAAGIRLAQALLRHDTTLLVQPRTDLLVNPSSASEIGWALELGRKGVSLILPLRPSAWPAGPCCRSDLGSKRRQRD